jgi:hypothetical protein
MTTIYANKRNVLPLGRCGENLTRQIIFDISNWESLYGVGTAELIYQRPTDERPYIMEITRENSLIHWEITAWHTAVEDGYGKCELRYYVDDILKKSETWSTRVDPALDTPSETIPPASEQGWVDQVLSAAGNTETAVLRAEAAAERAESAADKTASQFKIGTGLQMNTDNTLSVDCAEDFHGDNNRPASAILVKTQLGNIEAILATI